MTLVRFLSLLIFAAVCSSQNANVAQKIDDYRKQCVELSDVSVESAIKVHAGQVIDNPDWSTKRYVQCFFQKMQFMDENGAMLKDAVVEFFSGIQGENTAKAMVKNCDIQKQDPLDTAYEVLVCYQRNKSG
ncbi:general odorant-binding protein 56d-like [Armigeres subalbatus]|uniref:general odorant-binding protein 56d-like n=1 Tax=Armigeres subalbatus TaxID=124917 RepID=UPI002ED05D08